ncbi:MAG: carbon starvation protein A [Candidatus Cryptobacteroides sp.]|nr:carbon starvation protein A [Bacteroidales bacterium]
MYSFIISLAALVAGYFIYGRFVERLFGPEPSRKTPALTHSDGVDYIAMPSWKVFMIQFLNIAGTGPIFGAIMGAKFGPSAYLWIVFGCIFAGAVHDYLTGMLSVRNDGAALPEIVGLYLGQTTKKVLLLFSIIVLLLVGAVFVYSPALILGDMAGDGSRASIMLWVAVIFIYYVCATMLPIDKIIGKIYPLFAFALLFMAVALMACLFVKWPSIPEIWDGIGNLGEAKGLISGQTVFPCLFITIACGAVSGFHATQSPLMARCINNEKMGRPVFYGSMITEGVVALIWAAVSSYFFFDGGAAAVGSDLSASAPAVVAKVSSNWLGIVGGILALLGVVAAPITSGDTAFRSARLIIADFLRFPQKSVRNRFIICIPLFAAASLLLWYNVADENGFNVIWRYFGWANQTLAVFSLWTATVYMSKSGKGCLSYLVALIPAAFMTSVSVTYISVAKIGLNLPATWNWYIGGITFVVSIVLFYIWKCRKA